MLLSHVPVTHPATKNSFRGIRARVVGRPRLVNLLAAAAAAVFGKKAAQTSNAARHSLSAHQPRLRERRHSEFAQTRINAPTPVNRSLRSRTYFVDRAKPLGGLFERRRSDDDSFREERGLDRLSALIAITGGFPECDQGGIEKSLQAFFGQLDSLTFYQMH